MQLARRRASVPPPATAPSVLVQPRWLGRLSSLVPCCDPPGAGAMRSGRWFVPHHSVRSLMVDVQLTATSVSCGGAAVLIDVGEVVQVLGVHELRVWRT